MLALAAIESDFPLLLLEALDEEPLLRLPDQHLKFILQSTPRFPLLPLLLLRLSAYHDSSLLLRTPLIT